MAEMINPLSILLGARKNQADINAQLDTANYRQQALGLDREKLSQQADQFGQELGFKQQDSAMNAELKRQAIGSAAADRAALLKFKSESEKPVIVRGPDGKMRWARPSDAIGQEAASLTAKSGVQLPAAALKLQMDMIEDMNTASNSAADLAALESQIAGGGLKLGVVENALSRAKNNLGFSDDNSKNFQSFNSTLEKLRNDSLRLNKGVQTEGDAQRAWKELIDGINDPEVVRQRLQEIAEINQDGARLKAKQIQVLRQNFGAGDLDLTQFQNTSPRVGKARGGGRGIKFLGFEGQQ